MQCNATTRNNHQCKRKCTPSSSYCSQHRKQLESGDGIISSITDSVVATCHSDIWCWFIDSHFMICWFAFILICVSPLLSFERARACSSMPFEFSSCPSLWFVLWIEPRLSRHSFIPSSPLSVFLCLKVRVTWYLFISPVHVISCSPLISLSFLHLPFLCFCVWRLKLPSFGTPDSSSPHTRGSCCLHQSSTFTGGTIWSFRLLVGQNIEVFRA